MKLVVSSDWHADWSTYGVDRYDDVAQAVEASVRAAVEMETEEVAYIFTGDLADPDDAPRVVRAVSLALKTAVTLNAAAIDNYWLVGNHDVFEDGSGQSVLTPLAHVPERTTLLEMPYDLHFGALNVIALPYTASSHGYDPAMFVARAEEHITARERWGYPTVVLSHLSVPGVQPGEETTEMPRGREVVLPVEAISRMRRNNPKRLLVINGHYHRAQRLYLADVEIVIPGSIQRLTMGEERNEPGFLVLDI